MHEWFVVFFASAVEAEVVPYNSYREALAAFEAARALQQWFGLELLDFRGYVTVGEWDDEGEPSMLPAKAGRYLQRPYVGWEPLEVDHG